MPTTLFLPQFELGDIEPGTCEKQYVGSKYDTVRFFRDTCYLYHLHMVHTDPLKLIDAFPNLDSRFSHRKRGPSWSCSYGSWIYNYMCKSIPITMLSCELEPLHGEVYSIQHYVIQFVSDLRQVGCFLRVF